MKRMIVNKYGGPESLILEECDSPIIKELSVRIKVENVGVNFADTLVIKGRYQERPRPPFSPGLELSGTVIEVGKKVKTLKKLIIIMDKFFFVLMKFNIELKKIIKGKSRQIFTLSKYKIKKKDVTRKKLLLMK